MTRAAYILIIALVTTGCSLLTGTKTDEEIELSEARDRWRSLGLETYSIEKSRSCVCKPPYTYTIHVTDGEVNKVEYDLQKTFDTKPDTSPQDYQSLLKSTRSVEQLFRMLDHYVNSAYEYEVTFHPEYGYPTDISIDPVMKMKDEEIYRTLYNLQFNDPD